MKKIILFTLIILSFEGISAQAKKKSSVQKKKTTSKNIVSSTPHNKKIENSIFLLCHDDNEPMYEIVGIEQKKEYKFYVFYGEGKLLIFQGPSADEAIAKGSDEEGTWEESNDKIIITKWAGTSKYILQSNGDLNEDKSWGVKLRYLDKF